MGADLTSLLPGILLLVLVLVLVLCAPRLWRCLTRDARAVHWTMAAQGVLIVALLALPFGFDHPSSLGLAFDHFLLGLALYGVALVAGVFAAVVQKKHALAALQIAVPSILVALVLTGVLAL